MPRRPPRQQQRRCARRIPCGMSEATLLALLLRYPNPVAIARRVGASPLHKGLNRLERAGLVRRRGASYRITERGRRALELQWALQAALLVHS
jgi:hypothetical protein